MLWVEGMFCNSRVDDLVYHQGLIDISLLLVLRYRFKSGISQHNAEHTVIGAGIRLVGQDFGDAGNVAAFEPVFEVFKQGVLPEGMVEHGLCFSDGLGEEFRENLLGIPIAP